MTKSVCAEPPLPWAAKLCHMALPNLSIIIPTINEAERLQGSSRQSVIVELHTAKSW